MAEVSIFDFVVFEDTAESNPQIGTLEDAINLNDNVDPHQYFDSLSDIVALSDTATLTNRVTYVALSDTLVLSDEMWRKYETVSDFLFVYDWIEVPLGFIGESFVLSDTITGTSGPALSDTLEFDETTALTIVSTHTLTDTLTLTEGLHLYFNDPWKPMVDIPEARS